MKKRDVHTTAQKRYISTRIPNILVRGPYAGNHLEKVAESCPDYLILLLTKCHEDEKELVQFFIDNKEGLKELSKGKEILDNDGLFKFGKYHDTGKSVYTVAKIDPDYLEWVLSEINLCDVDQEIISGLILSRNK